MQCLFAVFGLAAFATAVEFEQQRLPYQQVQAGNYDDYYYGRPTVYAAETDDSEESRTHHKNKLNKKLKKRLLLQCLLQQHGHGRRRRDTAAASGRFLLPVVLQSTNVNVGSGGGGGGGYGNGGGGGYGHGGGGCMQMLNNHGPLGSIGSLLGSPAPVSEETGEGSRYLMYADWNRYARQFRRNIVRPLYQLF